MTSLIICFSGRIGSGKTSVSRGVAEVLNAAWTSFGDFVRSIATARSLDPTSREVLQDLGAELIDQRGIGWLCTQVIARAEWNDRAPLVIDGVRHVDVLAEIRRQLAPHRVVLIHLDFDGSSGRAVSMDAPSRLAVERHSTEREVLDALPAVADRVVSATLPFERVLATTLEFLRPLVSTPG